MKYLLACTHTSQYLTDTQQTPPHLKLTRRTWYVCFSATVIYPSATHIHELDHHVCTRKRFPADCSEPKGALTLAESEEGQVPLVGLFCRCILRGSGLMVFNQSFGNFENLILYWYF